MVYDYLGNHGLVVKLFNQGKYPAVLATFPGCTSAPVMLSGHFDVVLPEPDDIQFEPRIDGDYLWGRGSADMKSVVATYMVWMKDELRNGSPYPPISLLLVGNEENGEGEPMGTPHVLQWLEQSVEDGSDLLPRLLIAGERTGEKGDELWGEICTQNRGVMRFELIARGERAHSGVATAKKDLTERLFNARTDLMAILGLKLTLKSQDGWQSQLRMPFIQVGTPGIYNVTPDHGLLGVELRPIPQDNLEDIQDELARYCQANNLELRVQVKEDGIICLPDNPYLTALINSVRTLSGTEPVIGRKLPATSARFAPQGQGVVWGQSGIGPHSSTERHYIPSIMPYYQALHQLAKQPELH
jgi:acetylornithine deacetylase/succinyl-diaminopimelate desuccinylase-like protein